MDKKKYSLLDVSLVVFIFFFGLYLVLHFGYALDQSSKDIVEAASLFVINIENNPTNFFKGLGGENLKTFFTIYICFAFVLVAYIITEQKKYRKGKEHGSAKWGTMQEAKKLADKKDKNNNVLFTQNVQMSLNTRQTMRNLNQLTLGGSGTGKTRFVVKPNIMQANTSYVITDPKGEILRDTGSMLEKLGYKIKVFNLIDMWNSCNYNPMAYIDYFNKGSSYADKDIIKLINTLMKNTTKDSKSSSDPFWDNAERTLLLAIISYLYYEAPKYEQNFGMIIDLIRCAKVSEEDENFESVLDLLMKDLEKEQPGHIAVEYYGDFKQAAGKTAKSIIISALARLGIFAINQVVDLMSIDSIDIPKIGEEKTALFVIIPDSDDTFNCIVAMLYTQLFDILYQVADFQYGGRLPIHVRGHFDEFANIGTIPNFDKLIATMRSREISANIIVQNISQLKTMYKDNWESIIGNCDSFLFLGGKEKTSTEYVSKMLGKETIDTMSRNVSKGKSSSTSKNEGILGRELMAPDELEKMDNSECILFVRGYNPFKDKKLNIKKHKNYKLIGDANKCNNFDFSSVHTVTMKEAEEQFKAQELGLIDEEGAGMELQISEATLDDGDTFLFEEDDEKEQLIGDILASKIITGPSIEVYEEEVI